MTDDDQWLERLAWKQLCSQWHGEGAQEETRRQLGLLQDSYVKLLKHLYENDRLDEVAVKQILEVY